MGAGWVGGLPRGSQARLCPSWIPSGGHRRLLYPGIVFLDALEQPSPRCTQPEARGGKGLPEVLLAMRPRGGCATCCPGGARLLMTQLLRLLVTDAAHLLSQPVFEKDK